ncbi:response regulator [Haladaptatus sp. NG-WS-4]
MKEEKFNLETDDTAATQRLTDRRDNDMSDADIDVLVVDDESAVTSLYEAWLSQYRVFVANGGEKALSLLERHADEVSVVLLDRKMQGMSGDEVLSELRMRGYDCRVAMLTAVAPSYDIVNMPFDEYITKPVDGDTLRETVERLHERAAYADTLNRYYSLAAKQAVLVAEPPIGESEANAAVVEIEAEMRAVERELDDAPVPTDHREFQYLLREVT